MSLCTNLMMMYLIDMCDKIYSWVVVVVFNQVLQQPEARRLGGRVAGGVGQRLAARFLQQLLQATTPSSSSPIP